MARGRGQEGKEREKRGSGSRGGREKQKDRRGEEALSLCLSVSVPLCPMRRSGEKRRGRATRASSDTGAPEPHLVYCGLSFLSSLVVLFVFVCVAALLLISLSLACLFAAAVAPMSVICHR